MKQRYIVVSVIDYINSLGEVKAYLSDGRVRIELNSGKSFELSKKEVHNQYFALMESLKDEINDLKGN